MGWRATSCGRVPPPQLLPPPPRHYVKLKRAASALFRSRYLLLGAVALGVGLAVLAFNFTMEYAALNGETPLTELPSFQSMLYRTGPDVDELSWRPFLEGQFRSILLRMFIPYALLGRLDRHGAPDGSLTRLQKRLATALGIALAAACLIGSTFVRPRILFVTLASFGFFWALPMRQTTSTHHFEAIYYIGLPLVFFTIVLLLARRLTNRDGVIAAASVVALLLFAVSSFQMSRVGHSAETAQAARAAEQELLDIGKTTAGEPVTILDGRIFNDHFFAWRHTGHAMNYYLNTSLMRYMYLPAVEGGFVIMRDRIDTDALLTPHNQYFFLYDKDVAWSLYRSAASTEPLARAEFDVYLINGTVYYLKEPCERADAAGRFFLHVYPVDENDLPDGRRQYGFDNLDFSFDERGVLFDGKCLAIVDIPQYDIARFRTGRISGAGVQGWNAAPDIQGLKLISAYQSIVSTEPVARSEFDLYLDGGKLYYVKEPCGEEDTAARFFLHVAPEDENDLPDARREHGFDNLDFGFDVRGVLFDGKCTAAVPLPQYGIARIVTGQFDGAGRVWEIEFAPDARD